MNLNSLEAYRFNQSADADTASRERETPKEMSLYVHSSRARPKIGNSVSIDIALIFEQERKSPHS